jgi:methionine-rich copper-binding protein CopC
MTSLLEQAIGCDDGDRAAKIIQNALGIESDDGRVSLKPLGAGIYKVDWRAVSTDTHKTQGNFTFSVEAH